MLRAVVVSVGTRQYAISIILTVAIGVGAVTALSSIMSRAGSAYRLFGHDPTLWIMAESAKLG